jgi:hypothetical protein
VKSDSNWLIENWNKIKHIVDRRISFECKELFEKIDKNDETWEQAKAYSYKEKPINLRRRLYNEDGTFWEDPL